MSAKRKSFISYMLICQLGAILGLAWQIDLITATPLPVVAGGYLLGMVFAVLLYPVFMTLAGMLAENVRQHELNATGYDMANMTLSLASLQRPHSNIMVCMWSSIQ